MVINSNLPIGSGMSSSAALEVGVASDGKTISCETVFISTGGHRLAPGFQIRGYTVGPKTQLTTQLIYVECKGVEVATGSKLSFDYVYYTGEFNYNESEANKTNAKLEINLDPVTKGLEYPIAEPIKDLIKKPGDKLPAINNFVVTLADATRTEKGMELKWTSTNPSEYNNYVHLGNPPVIGEDGIIYGLYESPDMASPPITPPRETGGMDNQCPGSEGYQRLVYTGERRE